jgi:uncharacterized protein YndB with AHSA1/START domain
MPAKSENPEGFRIERSIHIAAPPSAIFPLITDFRRWTEWSPYEGLDPKVQRIYSGADQGVGAVYDWKGSSKVGVGRMEILETQAPARVRIKLDFFKPFEGRNTAEFAITPEAGGARVSWAMFGPEPCGNSVLHFIMGLIFNMEKMVGGQFEDGLRRLKAAVEVPAQAAA